MNDPSIHNSRQGRKLLTIYFALHGDFSLLHFHYLKCPEARTIYPLSADIKNIEQDNYSTPASNQNCPNYKKNSLTLFIKRFDRVLNKHKITDYPEESLIL